MDWPVSETHPGYRVKIIELEGCRVEVLRPILDEKAQRKAEERVERAMASAMASYLKRKETNKNEHHRI